MDKLTIEKIKTFHPLLREEAMEMYKEMCSRFEGTRVMPRFVYVLRTYKEQDDLFAIGRTKDLNKAKVTNARGGQSYHNFGLAFDIVMLQDRDGNGTFETASWDTKIDFDKDGISDWQEVVSVAKMYGYKWGGEWKSFPDAPHFEKTFNKSVIELDKMVKQGHVIAGTTYPIL